jgi:hypothetical protein
MVLFMAGVAGHCLARCLAAGRVCGFSREKGGGKHSLNKAAALLLAGALRTQGSVTEGGRAHVTCKDLISLKLNLQANENLS